MKSITFVLLSHVKVLELFLEEVHPDRRDDILPCAHSISHNWRGFILLGDLPELLGDLEEEFHRYCGSYPVCQQMLDEEQARMMQRDHSMIQRMVQSATLVQFYKQPVDRSHPDLHDVPSGVSHLEVLIYSMLKP